MSVAVRRSSLPVAALLIVYACSFGVVTSSWFVHDPQLFSAAVAFDLTITSSLLVWWLGVRRAGWPRWTLASTFAIGLLVARLALPDPSVVMFLVAVWGVIEIAVIAMAVGRIRRIVRAIRAFDGPGPVAALEAGLAAARVPARLAGVIATDLAVFWLGLTGWFRRPHAGFSMHRTTGLVAILGTLIALTVVETVLVHLLVVTWWGELPAWILSGLSIYSALWLAAHLHAVRLYPLRVTPMTIELCRGISWRCSIPRSAIARIDRITEAPKGALDASMMSPNLALVLAEPIAVRGLFGITRRRDVIAITVDDPDGFLSAVA